MLAAIRHLAIHHDRALAWCVAYISWSAGMAVDTATGNTEAGLLTNLGVAGLIVWAVLYMPRRSDARDAERVKDLKAEIAAERKRAEHAEEEARRLSQHMED